MTLAILLYKVDSFCIMQRLLLKQRKNQWLPSLPEYDTRNILTLGYEEGRPDLDGYRIRDSNSIMCFYPNSLVSAYKETMWEMYHQIVGDDCMIFLLSHHAIFVLRADIRPTTYLQVSLSSIGPKAFYNVNQIAGPKLGTLIHLEREIRSKKTNSEMFQRIMRINSVLYARDVDQVEKKSLFPSSHIFFKELRNCRKANAKKLTHAAASRIVRMIFSSEKLVTNPATSRSIKVGRRIDSAKRLPRRLPKRLIQVIPLIEEMLQAISECNRLDQLSKQTTFQKRSMTLKPPRSFLRYCMRAHNRTRLRIANYGAEMISNPARSTSKIAQMEDEYWSQEEINTTSNARKKRRYEEALDAINVSTKTTKERKRQNAHSDATDPGDCRTGSLREEATTSCSGQPMPLQQHASMITQLLRYATSKQHVYLWIRDWLALLLPSSFFGIGDTGSHNWRVLRRFLRVLLKSSTKNDSFCARKVAPSICCQSNTHLTLL